MTMNGGGQRLGKRQVGVEFEHTGDCRRIIVRVAES